MECMAIIDILKVLLIQIEEEQIILIMEEVPITMIPQTVLHLWREIIQHPKIIRHEQEQTPIQTPTVTEAKTMLPQDPTAVRVQTAIIVAEDPLEEVADPTVAVVEDLVLAVEEDNHF